jgi:hypothetical protein
MPNSDRPLRLYALPGFRGEPVDYPEEVWRFVAVAQRAGYRLMSEDAHAIWRQYSDGLCAGWLTSEGLSDEQILETLLDHGVSGPDIPIPRGHNSWLDYAVDTLRPPDTHPTEGPHALEAVRQAARAELALLRRPRVPTPPVTSPAQRTHSVLEARALLDRLAQLSPTANLPTDIPATAGRLLRHYPGSPELDISSDALPCMWGSPWVPDLEDDE